MKRHVTVTQSWDLTIDIPDDNVRDITEGYQAIIDSTGDIEEVVDHIAYNYCINDCKEFVEGVGHIQEAEITIKMTDYNTDVDVRDED